MKKTLTLLSLLITFNVFSQGSWVQKTKFTGTARYGAVGFAIGNKGYITTGESFNLWNQDLWEWDQSNDTWTQKANLTGSGRRHAVGFSIGNKGYVSTGETSSSVYANDLWEWNQNNNTWTKKTDLPGPARILAVAFSIGTKGYISTGCLSIGTNGPVYTKDLWEWDQASDTWKKMADFGGIARAEAVGFSIGNKGYIGTGYASGVGYKQDFWEWDQATNTWMQKADFGGSVLGDATGFSIGVKGYIGTGYTISGGNKKLFWEWDQAADTWTKQADYAGTAIATAIGFSIGGKGYIGTGFVGVGNYKQDFWEFTPSATVTDIQESMLKKMFVYPNPSSGKIMINSSMGEGEMFVYSVIGEQIFHSTMQQLNNDPVDLSGQPGGIYFLTFANEQGSFTQKFILQNQ